MSQRPSHPSALERFPNAVRGIIAGLALALATILAVGEEARGASRGLVPTGVDQIDTDPNGLVRFARGSLSGPSTEEPATAARRFLDENAEWLGLSAIATGLELVYVRRGEASTHVRFVQTLDGLRVEGAEVFVHMDGRGAVQTVQNHATLAHPTVEPRRVVVDENRAIARAYEIAGVQSLRGEVLVERVWVSVDARLAPAWEVTVPAARPLGDWVVLVDATDGASLGRRNDLRHATGQGKVFNPDPVRTSGNVRLEDNDDRDSAELRGELQDVTLENLDGSGYLRGPWADASSSRGRAFSPSGVFLATRSHDMFEQVMFYHHIDRVQTWFGELGVTGANRRRQVADVHGTPADNSFYSPITKKITFGTGGVDDAEDADIILHEYGHAIQDNQVPGWGQSHESGSMGEGFGDWLAATFFSGDEHGSVHDAVVGDWDATSYSRSNPPALRRVDANKMYPDDLRGSVHSDGEIWSRALWDLRWSVGRDDAMRLVLESHFYCTPRSGFREGALAVLSADEALFGGRYYTQIRTAFLDRGILTESEAPAPAPELECRVGATQGPRGTFQDVLAVNGSTGAGSERSVVLDSTSDVTLEVRVPEGQESARFVLYAFLGQPSADSVSVQPYGVGTLCFAGVLTGGNPDAIWNNWRHHRKVGAPDFPSEPAPSSVVHTQAELGLGSEWTVQGYVQNQASTAEVPASVTNAIAVRVE